MRLIEAVFDQTCHELTVKVTPVYSFLKNEEAPWGLFMTLAATVPQEGLPSRMNFDSSHK